MMNDRYLFRGKRADNGEWETGFLVVERSDTSEERFYITDKMTGYHTPIIPETVGQCTGLKGKNGKLIFEGDIVEWYSDYDDIWGYSHTAIIRAVVVWDDKNYCWGFKVDDEIASFNEWDWDISMVLGNIYDNPELLEVEE